jgi:microcystin-dependent protein
MDYYIGQQAIFISTRPNTVAGLVQIDVDGKGSKFIKRFDGNNPKYGELSGLLHLVYDGTYFRIINHTQNDVEIGDIKPSVLDTNHNNWLLCNGQAISRNDYSELFNLIGTSFGSGDGETTFNVPDYRGKFLRGLGGNSAADIYTTQVEGLPNIEGSIAATALYNTLGNEIADGAFYFGDAITEQESAGSDEYMQHKICFDASRANNIYGASQHVTPVNQAVNWFIKAR